jgi:hypothetical protein
MGTLLEANVNVLMNKRANGQARGRRSIGLALASSSRVCYTTATEAGFIHPEGSGSPDSIWRGGGALWTLHMSCS